jgi:hypothetical protein
MDEPMGTHRGSHNVTSPDMVLMRTDQGDGYVNLTAAAAFEVAQDSPGGAWAVYAKFAGVNGIADPSTSPDCVEIPGTYSGTRVAAEAKLDALVRDVLQARIYEAADD